MPNPSSPQDNWGDTGATPGGAPDPFAPLRAPQDDEIAQAKKPWLPLALVAFLVLALLGGFATFALLDRQDSGSEISSGDIPAGTQPDYILVPSVVGLSEAAATSKLAAAGLSVESVAREISTEYDPGRVLRQRPAAGSGAVAGGSVSLTLVEAPPPQVPDLIGLTEFAAINALLQQGLRLGAVEEENSDKPKGEVVGQSLEAGTDAEPGSSVDIYVSNGKIQVPDVTSQTRAEAIIALENAGFSVKVQLVGAEPGDRILSTSPAAGVYALRGSTIVVLVPDSTEPPRPDPSVSPAPKPTTGPQCSSLNFTLQAQEEAARRGIPFIGLNDYKCVGNWAVVTAQFGMDPYIFTEVFAVKKGKNRWEVIPKEQACTSTSGLPPSLYSRVCS
jgi:beta-lactam-binding protein with PASTA domain